MKESLEIFADEYRDDGTEISKFKKYRQRFAGSVTIGLVLLAANLFQEYRNIFQGFPYPNYSPYLPAATLIAVGLILYHGKRDMDVSTQDITYYEIASAIEATREDNIGNALNSISELKTKISRNGNTVFSDQTVERVKTYQGSLENSQNPENILDDTFEDFFDELIQELSEEKEMDNILQDISNDNDNEFEGSLMLDSIKRIGLDMWSILTLVAMTGSLLIFNFVGQDSGYYVAIISLTAIQILRGQQE